MPQSSRVESQLYPIHRLILINATDTGGTCICAKTEGLNDPFCLNANNPALVAYNICKQGIQRDLITGTAAIAALSSFSMGLFANMPIALAPGMGLNAYFAYQVVGANGSGVVSYRLALTAVFVEGLIFIALTVMGLRQWLARVVPPSLKIASGAGIGLYLAIIGLTYTAGIGAITGGGTSSPVQLAGCIPSNRDPVTGMCNSGKMRNPTMWIGLFCGGMFTAFLMMYRVKGAIIAGILLVSIISWPRDTPVTYFPHTPVGDNMFEFFKKVVFFHPIEQTLVAQDWNITGEHSGQFALALITFLYVDILDATGTLYSMATFCGVVDPDTQDFEGSAVAYLIDAAGITIGSLFGSPPVTAFIESGAGISEGGKTGITACTTGLCFFISLFFAPIFASIPPWATGCTLILVGAMMCRACADINWRYLGDSIPAFLTLAIMPFTYSIAYGLITGIITYAILNIGVWIVMKVSKGRAIPWEYDQKDFWTYRVRGGIIPGWVRRVAKGKKDFWRDWDYDAEELTSRDSDAMTKQNRGSAMTEGAGPAIPMTGMTGDTRWATPGIMGYDGYGDRPNGTGGVPGAASGSSRGS